MPSFTTATGLVLSRAIGAARRQIALAVVAPTLLAVLVVVLFDTAFGAIARTPGWPVPGFVDWVAPGAVFLTVFVGAGFSAASLADDVRSGYLDRLRLCGAHPAAHVAGRALFEGLRAIPPAAGVLAMAVALGVDIAGGLFGAAVLLALTALFAAAWNGLFLAVALRSADPAAVVGMQPIFMPVIMFSTFWAPVTFMPRWYETVAQLNPFSRLLEVGRELLLGDASATSVALASVTLVCLVGLATAAAGRAYARIEQEGVR